jgi:hypothetical protein
MSDNVYRQKGNVCPFCFKLIDAATSLDSDTPPDPEDITICVYCTSWLIFNDDMSLRVASQKDIEALPQEFVYRLIKATKALEEFNRLYGKP